MPRARKRASPEGPLRVLLVEDEPAFARWLAVTVARISRPDEAPITIESAGSLADGIALHGKGDFDIVLLDLGLPDSDGLATVDSFVTAAPGAIVIVLTGTASEDLAIQALHHGAQDFVDKNDLEPRRFLRTLRHALARSDARAGAGDAVQEAQTQLEVARLERDEPEGSIEVPPMDDQRWIMVSRSLATAFDLAIRGGAADRGLDDALRNMARQLFEINAGPRDFMRIYTGVLRSKVHGAPPSKAEAYMDEGRLVALGIIGFLAEEYRVARLGALP